MIWILGGPGSGKGTQCAKIVEKFGFSHFSTGDLLRAEVQAGTDKGKELAEIMKRGDLVPNEEVLYLLQKAMKEVQGKAKGFLIDGYVITVFFKYLFGSRLNNISIVIHRYPREKSQGVAFEQTIAPVDLIISLECKPVILTFHFFSSKQTNSQFFFMIIISLIGNNGIAHSETCVGSS